MKRRIVVTGMGVVSCFGNDVSKFYQTLLSGVSGAKSITQFPCDDYTTRFAAFIEGFDPGEDVDKKQARRIDPCIAYTMVAGKRALKGAAFDFESVPNDKRGRYGVVIGSGMGGMGMFCQGVEDLLEKGPRRVSPFFVPFILTNMGGGLLAKDIGFWGPNYSISTACATANNSIIAAATHIRNGETDLMICGGSEAPIIPMGLVGFSACRALSTRNEAPEKASRPWDKGRDGFVMGEGAGVLVLEELEHALKRGAPILAEYRGGGLSCDAYHMTEPRPDGAGVILCLKNALQDASVSANDVNYVNAHATSTAAGDMAEIAALKGVLPNPKKVVINATKSMIGHSLGAAGGLEAVATVMAIVTKKVHPTINLEDPEEGLDFVAPTKEMPLDVKVALSNSFGFGGHNATVVFSPFVNK